jgi:hypothetical protein
LGHLGLIVLDASYDMAVPTTPAGLTIWVNPTAPRVRTINVDQGTAVQLSAARRVLEDTVLNFRTFNTVQQALKK